MEIVLLLASLMAAAFLGNLLVLATEASRRRASDPKRKLATNLFEVSYRIDAEHHKARRDMNDAAGQSWRNLVE